MSASTYLEIAKECLRRPGQDSYWSPEKKKYVCPDEAGMTVDPRRLRDSEASETTQRSGERIPPIIKSNFKLIFVTAASGTLIFTALCYGTVIYYGGEMPGAAEELVKVSSTMFQIGFGAIVGLLGGKAT